MHATSDNFVREVWLTNKTVWKDLTLAALMIGMLVFGPMILPGNVSRLFVGVVSFFCGFLVTSAFYHPMCRALLDDLEEAME